MLRSLLVVASLVTAISTAELAMAQSGSRGGGMFGSGSRSYAPVPSQSYGNQSYGSPSYSNQSYGSPVYRSRGYSRGASYGGGCGASGHAIMYYAPVQSGCGASSCGSAMYYGGSSACGSSCGAEGGQYTPSQSAPMQYAPSQSAPMQPSPAGSGTSSSTYRPDHSAMRLSSSSSGRTVSPRTQTRSTPIQYNAPPRPDDSVFVAPRSSHQ